ncbi:MAG TPA: histidinol dehydrogenase [Feifaniaceae bacterium]|nr:histidinol dehydrogenase [Feifaniaceae bacterium]
MKIILQSEIESCSLFCRVAEVNSVGAVVSEILRDVAENGDRALFHYAKLFDRAELTSLEVPPEELEAALAETPNELLSAMQTAAENIRAFHQMQVRQGFCIQNPDGSYLGQKITPIERVGLYIPGGTASYPSTVLMNAIPAKIAGCEQIFMVSPPSKNGKIASPILAAAKLAGVDRVFQVGGAQAIAALAYGTETIPKVDKIVGPGNAYVAEAKRQVFGRVSIDMIAGPSEILIIADESANPAFLAADLLSQAEHDALASAILITPSLALAKRVSEEVERQLKLLPREKIARASIENNGKILIAADLASAVALSNRLAPEHLELCVSEPEALLEQVKNAGSVFLGSYSPEALGDYLAGPNHTLPTGGTARFSSPLGVDDFIKKTQYTFFTPEALASLSGKIAVFARAEGLEAHARAALIRNGEQ